MSRHQRRCEESVPLGRITNMVIDQFARPEWIRVKRLVGLPELCKAIEEEAAYQERLCSREAKA